MLLRVGSPGAVEVVVSGLVVPLRFVGACGLLRVERMAGLQHLEQGLHLVLGERGTCSRGHAVGVTLRFPRDAGR